MKPILLAIAALMLAVAGTGSAFAVEEARLPGLFDSQILPSYLTTGTKGVFQGKAGVPIAWAKFPPANGAPIEGAKAVLIINGRTEFMRKYAEMIFDLRNLESTPDQSLPQYSVYTMDHRGQGESGRMLPQSEKGYVAHFKDYVDDFSTFIDQIVNADHPSEIHVIAHSMGGAIVTIYSIKHPGVLKSMSLSAPMYQPNLGKYPEPVALMIGWFADVFGQGTDLAPGRSLDEWKQPFEGNQVSHSMNRYGYAHDMEAADPALAVGGPTFNWVEETLVADNWIHDHAGEITTPIHLFQAQNEEIVMNPDEDYVCGKAKSCERQLMSGANHEMFMEADSIRNEVLKQSVGFILKNSQ